MANWLGRPWKWWITQVEDLARVRRRHTQASRHGGRHLEVEALEDRLAPAQLLALEPPLAVDDSVSTARNSPLSISVLANDSAPNGTLDATSLTVTAGAGHGTASLQLTPVTTNDDSSPVGNGRASALKGLVDDSGHIRLAVSGYPDLAFKGNHSISGDYSLFVRLGESDFSHFTSNVFDFRFAATLAPGAADPYTIMGQTPGTPFIAWIDNTVGSGSPDTVLGSFVASGAIDYTPDPGFEGADAFTYTVRDNAGIVSNQAKVNVTVFNVPPVAMDDFAATDQSTPVSIHVLANDGDSDGTLNPSSLAVSTGPAHGSVVIQQSAFLYTPDPGFAGTDVFTYTVQDNDGAVSNAATVAITVSNVPPVAANDSASTGENTPVSIDVLANDYDPNGTLNQSSLTISKLPGHGSVVIQHASVVYTPDPGTRHALVVDDPSDVDDGNYSPGHLSLREAIRLANSNGFTDAFRYTVRDSGGNISNQGTVTVVVTAQPTTITFAPGLTAARPATLSLSHVGDTSAGNSALAITTPITIQGPAGVNGITLAGPGSTADLRAFLVANGAALNLQNLTLRNWSTDGSGSALNVLSGGTATLTNCTLSNNAAFADGGAVSNFGTLTLSASNVARNSAGSRGGGLYNAGMLTLTHSTLSGNHAEQGAGLFNEFGTVNASDSALCDNTAGASGGGFVNYLGTMTFALSTLSGNSAHQGGGFRNSGMVTLNHCAIAANSAPIGGGFDNEYTVLPIAPLHPYFGTVTATNTAISHNNADQGGGFYNSGTVTLTGGAITENQAVQGGGLFNGLDSGAVTLTNVVVTGNRAEQGGGIFNDLGAMALIDCTISGNTARSNGGGLFNNSTLSVTNSRLSANSAKSGGGFFNKFVAAALTDSTIAGNTALRGAGYANEFGTVSLTNTAVTDRTAQLDIAPQLRQSPPFGPTGSVPSLDNAQYKLDRSHQLWQKAQGSPQTLIDVGVQSFKKAPNGDVYWLTDQQELKRMTGGYATTTLQVGVQSYAMDVDGAVFAVDNLGRRWAYQALDQYYVLPAIPAGVTPRAEDPPADMFILRAARIPVNTGSSLMHPPQYILPEPLYPFERELASLGGIGPTAADPAPVPFPGWATWDTATNRKNEILIVPHMGYDDIRVVTELLVDTIDPPRFFPGVGLAQMHHEQWTATIYYNNSTPEQPEVQVIYIDKSHLHLYVPGSPITTAFSSSAVGLTPNSNLGTQATTDGPGQQASSLRATPQGFVSPAERGSPRDRTVQSLTVGRDGTIYQFGGGANGHAWVGTDNSPVMLLRLTSADPWASPHGVGPWPYAGGAWTPVFQLYSVDALMATWSPKALSDGTAYVLEGNVLRRLRLGSTQWETLDVGVKAFTLAPGGTIYEVTDRFELRMLRPGDRQPTVLDSGFHYGGEEAVGWGKFMMSPDGTLYELNANQELRRLLPGSRQMTVLDTGVQEFWMAGDGTLYEVKGNQELKRLEGRNDWTLIDTHVISLGQLLRDGTRAYITGSLEHVETYQLKLWQPPFFVGSFTVAPNNTLYAVDSEHRLRMQLPGSIQWSTLEVGVKSFSMSPDGTVYALNDAHQLKRLMDHGSWAVLAEGVQSFSMATDGAIYALTAHQQLLRMSPDSHGTSYAPTAHQQLKRMSPDWPRWTILDVGVQSMTMTNGTLYELNGLGQLKRLAGGAWTVLDKGVQSFALDKVGTLYALDKLGQLKQLTTRDHWTILQTGVQSFLIAPSAFNNVYVLLKDHELKRLEVGYYWQTLRDDVVSITMGAGGTVYAQDALGQVGLYWSPSTSPLMPPIGSPPPLAEDPPDEATILRAANIIVDMNPPQYIPPSPDFPLQNELAGLSAFIAAGSAAQGPSGGRNASVSLPGSLPAQDIQTVAELSVDTIDPPRYFPNVGLAQMHHSQWKCTIYYNDANGPQVVVVFIDKDHLHLLSPPGLG